MELKKMNLLVVGLGVIGGSYVQRLSSLGIMARAFELSQESIDLAMEKGWISEGSTEIKEEWIHDADFILCSLYPTLTKQWIVENQKYMKPHTLITDVSGVKGSVVEPIQKELRKDLEFIGSHPMAGKESKGLKYADGSRFMGANFIITPTDQNTPEAIEFMKDFARTVGFGRISCLTCEEHDQMIGYVSQLTHAIAVSLMNANSNPRLSEFTGDSFRDLTRIAKINETMWAELFDLNEEALVKEIDQFIAELESLKNAIENHDRKTMEKMFIQSTKRRIEFEK